MPWQELHTFADPRVGKLDTLRRADASGLRVPPTVWAPVPSAPLPEHPSSPPPAPPSTPPPSDPPPSGMLAGPPWIVRSASPHEDTDQTSNAGQRLSLPVARQEDFANAVRRVAATAVGGAVFVQPLLAPEHAGVAFFDAWWYERTEAAGSNEALTSGRARGEVTRGHRERGDAWSAWIDRIWRVFRTGGTGGAGREGALDIEYARDGDGYTLLQVRPALFAVRRNPTLSLANHREILGDPPSPWIVSVLAHAGRAAPLWFARVDRAIARWDEPYAVAFAERAWMNFSFFFRLMDRWGLPRVFVTDGVGGAGIGGNGDRAKDRSVDLPRMLRNAPRLLAMQVLALADVVRLPAGLRTARVRIARARTLRELFEANAAALAFALRSNFAINAVLSGTTRIRRALRLKGRARVVTEAMMDDYDALRGNPAGLDAWLKEYGHRGPLESDPSRPRFGEMREALLADLEHTGKKQTDGDASDDASGARGWRPWFWIDRRREWFRDELMRLWVPLRRRLREKSIAVLGSPDEIFWLRSEDIERPDITTAVAESRARHEAAAQLDLPGTASLATLEMHEQRAAPSPASGTRTFTGIALHPERVEGTVYKARELGAVLGRTLPDDAVLVVPALEPSWAVVFGRVRAVVAEIGGELSHASILLREAQKPAAVNCAGIFAAARDGERICVENGVVTLSG